MQCACVILLSVACPAPQGLSTQSHKGHNFRRKLLSIKCEFWFYLQFCLKTFFYSKKNLGVTIKNVYRSSCEESLIFCQVSTKLKFSRQIFEKYSNIRFIKNLSRGNRTFACGETDGRTDMTWLIVVFSIFRTRLKFNFNI